MVTKMMPGLLPNLPKKDFDHPKVKAQRCQRPSGGVCGVSPLLFVTFAFGFHSKPNSMEQENIFCIHSLGRF